MTERIIEALHRLFREFFVRRAIWASRGGLSTGRPARFERTAAFYCSSKAPIRLGSVVAVGRGAILATHSGYITIGSDCSIGNYSILYGHGGLEIGNDVMIADRVTIVPANHRFDDSEKVMWRQGETRKGVVIGNDVWIASHAVILDGVSIGDHAVVAAGAVVTKNVAPWSVVGGVPARQLAVRPSGTDPAPTGQTASGGAG